MTTKDLALKHLGIDLTGSVFWEMVLDRILADVDEFTRLADSVGRK